ncbi:MAG TPA: hypothetical protein ENI17_11735 [Pseudomonas xinjiangensis]|uniref:DUF3307 domain-containing protein n=2 Tax=root TaxID=1 RepID=A0A7V1BL32_9GAMM|nr:hypothetical protein [Halopseudomonas xinjiangensis]HEC48283.1 hypothetical protein [Halopseudomonas xinjiangensis]
MPDSTNLLLLLLIHTLATLLIYMFPFPADAAQRQRYSWLTAKALPYGMAVGGVMLATATGVGWSLVVAILVITSQLTLETLKQSKARNFAVDLMLTHLLPLALLLAIWCSSTHNWQGLGELLSTLFEPEMLILLIAYMFMSHPTSALIAQLLRPWLNNNDLRDEASLKNAGKLIGFLERFLILTFVLLGQWSAIGFLLAAKSIMRFNDTRTAQRPVSEYVLLGTLLSFTFSLMMGITVSKLLYG